MTPHRITMTIAVCISRIVLLRAPADSARRNKRKETSRLDTVGQSARILRVLVKGRILTIGAAVCAAAAVLALGIMPPTHLHRSISGTLLVHSHLINDPVAHAGTFNSGDDHGEPTFATVFVAERTATPGPAFTAVAAFVLARPQPRSLSYRNGSDAPVIHGPPRAVLSLRAPPS
jgi:hypothetical protein